MDTALKSYPQVAQLKLWENILVRCDSDSFSDGTVIDTVIPFKLDTLQESNFSGPPISICHIQRDVPVQWYTLHFEVKGYPFLLNRERLRTEERGPMRLPAHTSSDAAPKRSAEAVM